MNLYLVPTQAIEAALLADEPGGGRVPWACKAPDLQKGWPRGWRLGEHWGGCPRALVLVHEGQVLLSSWMRANRIADAAAGPIETFEPSSIELYPDLNDARTLARDGETVGLWIVVELPPLNRTETT